MNINSLELFVFGTISNEKGGSNFQCKITDKKDKVVLLNLVWKIANKNKK